MEFNTVGELRNWLAQFPDDKPLIMDIDGNTRPVEIDNWSDAEPDDINWPVAVFVR